MRTVHFSPEELEALRIQIQEDLTKEYFRHFPNITFLLFLSYFWETVEHYFELSSTPFLQRVFHSEEFWWNRIITDNLCILLGYFIAFQFRKIRFFGWGFACLYLIVVVLAYIYSPSFSLVYPDGWTPFWGPNTDAFFDVWSFVHVFTGTVFGSFVIWWNREVPRVLVEWGKIRFE